MAPRSFVAASLLALLCGCGERLADAGAQDRHAALRACSDRAILAVLPRDSVELLSSLRRLETCMAVRDLRGRATYDPKTNAVRFAYEPERPSLRF
jgi:hypothetical protein